MLLLKSVSRMLLFVGGHLIGTGCGLELRPEYDSIDFDVALFLENEISIRNPNENRVKSHENPSPTSETSDLVHNTAQIHHNIQSNQNTQSIHIFTTSQVVLKSNQLIAALRYCLSY
mmetsp:Transcript_9771/g.17607  ORF Transcript_9771/g.17607 Transcript_9771/m.17607 type:complete len:117 (-) Transcript_9771:1222-1572(-)